MDVLKKVKNVIKKTMTKITGSQIFDMSSKESRERQVMRDFEDAKTEKYPYTCKMVEMNNYYNNKPYTEKQARQLQTQLDISFTPPVLPDPFIQVESQIDDVIPTFQFTGKEGTDPSKIKEREQAADYVLYNNGIVELNLDNERALNELGNAFWKIAWDDSITGLGFTGDLVIGNPDPSNIFPDPNAYDIDDCEYIIYAFRAHRRKLRRIFGDILDSIVSDGDRSTTEIYESNQNRALSNDETLLVTEYWYKDDEGDIACSIQINYEEVKFIPKYWVNTRHSGNKMYPIIKYGKIPVRKSFWDKGEIETCKELFDAGNREFITAILNDAFMANDITLYEEGALAEGEEMSNVPGANIKLKQNGISKVKRLGGIAENTGILNMINFIHDKIQETNGNYDSSQGKEPLRVTTASGIAQLNEKSESRKTTKKAGRTDGFKRLAQLIDWSILEFYNLDRMLLIRAKEGEPQGNSQPPINFNSDNHAVLDAQGNPYYPKVDVEIVAGDGIKKSKAFTLQATQELASTVVTPENLQIVLSQVDLLDLPNKEQIKSQMTQAVQTQQARLQAQSQPVPPKTPAESITFKDMPPNGKIQMAQQVGIQLTAQDFIDTPTQTDPNVNPDALKLTELELSHKQLQEKHAHEIEKLNLQHANDLEKMAAKNLLDAHQNNANNINSGQ